RPRHRRAGALGSALASRPDARPARAAGASDLGLDRRRRATQPQALCNHARPGERSGDPRRPVDGTRPAVRRRGLWSRGNGHAGLPGRAYLSVAPLTHKMLEFTYRTARSGAITSAIVAVIAIESLAVHFAVATRRPVLAWALTLTSVGAVYWLVRDYLALGSGTVRLSEESVRLAIGRRSDIEIPLASIARA